MLYPPISVHKGITLEEFKGIFFWEYTHRIWGRLIGLAFAVPGFYFMTRKHIPSTLKRTIFAIASGIGFQVRWPIGLELCTHRPASSVAAPIVHGWAPYPRS
jgi:hypothetical protein